MKPPADRITAALEQADVSIRRLRTENDALRAELAIQRRAVVPDDDPAVDRMLDTLESVIDGLMRKSEGNPYHKGKGDGGGQFASGPGGGGGAAGKAHGKHHAKRQRRKLRQAKKKGEKPGKSGAHPAGKPVHKEGEKAGARGNREHSPNAKEAMDRVRKGKPAEYASEKAKRAAEHQSKTDGEVQTYTKANESRLAKRIGGESFPDNDPADVHVSLKDGSTRGIELKTLTHGTNDKVTMKGDALARKVAFQGQSKRAMYTVVLDHRDRFAGGKNEALHSGHEIYMKAGTGSFRIGAMYKVKDDAELNRLVRMTPGELAKVSPKLKGDTRGTNR